MKHLSFLLTALLFFALACASAPAEDHTHQVLCAEPDVCQICGAVLEENEEREVIHGNAVLYSGELMHWHICEVCGETLDYGYHTVICSSPDVCTVCGTSTADVDPIMLDITHEGDPIIKYNENYHVKTCVSCGMDFDIGEHECYCDEADAGVCSICGVPKSYGIQLLIRHRSKTLMYDETHHWYSCSACGEEFGKQIHSAYCTSPNTCYTCGAPYNGEQAIVHLDYSSNILFDDECHWNTCSACGQESAREPHYTYCGDPAGICSYCGAPSDRILHVGYQYFYFDENEHFFTCVYCGETLTEPHQFVDGYCYLCDAEEAHTIHSNAAGLWENNETMHWQICDVCGNMFNIQSHAASCTERDVCMVCGVKKEDAQIDYMLHTDVVPQHDAARHWDFCEACGDIVNVQAHYAPCTAAEACQVCGAAAADGAEIRKNHEHIEYRSDSQRHWTYCLDCGLEYGHSPHYALCSDPKTCAECGAAYQGYDIRHTSLDMEHAQHNSYAHWYRCLDCGGQTREERHYIRCGSPEGVCTGCGVPWYGTVKHVNDSKAGYSYLNEQYHMFLCTVCGQLVREEHTNIDEYCPLCGGKGPHRHVLRRIEHKEPGCEDGYNLYQCWQCGAEEIEILPGSGSHQTVQISVGSAVIPYCTVCRQAVVDAPCREISIDGQTAVIRDLNACLDQNSNILMAFSIEPPQRSSAGTAMDSLTVSIQLPERITEDALAKASLYKAEEMKETVVITFDMEEDDLVFQIDAPAISFSVNDRSLIFQANEFGIYFVAE